MDRKDIEQCSLDALVLETDKDAKDCKLASNPEFKREEAFLLVTSEEAKDFKLKTEFEEQEETPESNKAD